MMTKTENGAVTYATSGSACLDLFSTIGALRNASDIEILQRFIRAYTENPDLAMKIIFFARDIRGGLGERRVFKTIFSYLAKEEPQSVKKNISLVADYGRYDDLLALMGTPCEGAMLAYLKEQYESDVKAMGEGNPVSLLGKWLPSVNASCKETIRLAKKIAKAFGLSEATYRKQLTALRGIIKIIENNLREKDYTFDYSKQPSRAMFKYRKAFIRNDKERYSQFVSQVAKGETKMNARLVYPYELVEAYLKHYPVWANPLSEEEKATLNATWEAMPDVSNDENAIAVVDTSGSMYRYGYRPQPASIALSLGLYFAERNKGAFHNHFIEFSERPQLIELKGNTFLERLRYALSFNVIADTNIEAVFDLILHTAVKHKVPQEELPAKVVIISDMEFNYCVKNASLTNFQMAKQRFATHGYTLPEVVFWNVDSRQLQQPVTMHESGVVLVSGVTPQLFSMVQGGVVSPYGFMLSVLSNERYAPIVA